MAKPKTRQGKFIFKLRKFTLAHAKTSPGFLRKHRRAIARLDAKRPRYARRLRLALALLWRSKTLRRVMLAADSRVNATDIYGDVFDRHHPDVVVTTSPGFAVVDTVVLREAARRRVRTAALVLGWDNPTSKGYRGATPDRVLVWSKRMADRLRRFQDFRRRRIAVTGVPHFDLYARPGALPTWEELCRQEGLDPARRLVLFATSAPGGWSHNERVAETLARAVDDGVLGDAQLVVRVHPINFRADHVGKLTELRALAERHPHVHLNLPHVLSQRLRCDLHADDGPRLGGLLRHCAVLVNVFSTTTVEAFLLDRPVVMVAADAALDDDAEEERAALLKTEGAWEEYAHLRQVVEQGAARIARSMPHLVELVRLYMDEPELDREERVATAIAECGPVDGRAGERVAREVLALCGSRRR